MNAIRERILIDMTPYKEFSEHKDLISFCVCSECFIDYEDAECGEITIVDYFGTNKDVTEYFIFKI
jgi:hypothetical protein